MADLSAFFGSHCKTGSFVPVVVFGRTISFERRGANQLLRAAMNAYEVAYEVHRIESYNCRKTTSGKSWSAHAWAAAVDVNPEQNPLSSTLKTDMPKAFIKAFTDEGFGWGGNWSTSKDAMHFSLSPNEGGSPKPEPFDRKLQKLAIALWLERHNGVNVEPTPPKPKRPGKPAPPFGGVVLDRERNARKVDPAVLTFQQQLIERGWDLQASGKFDAKTEQVVRAFQREKRLFVDGKVGKNTWRAIWESAVT